MTVEVQHRVRETALDFDVFLEDLKQWTREVQQKDKALRCLEFALDKKEECRTSAPASAKYIPVKVRARARLLLDNAEGEFENRDSSKHGTFLEELLKIGNGCFRKREYDSAILHYSRYIQTHRNSSAAFANRAMCHMNNKCWALAEVDCTYALEVDPNNVKALHRRGSTRQELGKELEATMDFEQALRFRPNNKFLFHERYRSRLMHEITSNVRHTSLRKVLRLSQGEQNEFKVGR